jgi:hypothetical protein
MEHIVKDLNNIVYDHTHENLVNSLIGEKNIDELKKSCKFYMTEIAMRNFNDDIINAIRTDGIYKMCYPWQIDIFKILYKFVKEIASREIPQFEKYCEFDNVLADLVSQLWEESSESNQTIFVDSLQDISNDVYDYLVLQ